MPPKIVKQTTTMNVRKSTGTIADRIGPVSDALKGIKINVYGKGKTGKTRFASTFPRPLLLIGSEDGTLSLKKNEDDLHFIQITKAEEVTELVDHLKGGGYKTVVLDHAGGLQDLVLKSVLNLEDIPLSRSWGMAQQSDWQVIGNQMKEHLRSLLDLSLTHDMNVVIIAHERNFNEDSNSDIITPTVGSAISPATANWLNGACDYICQTFIREGTEDVKALGDTGPVIKSKTGKFEYCLRTGPHNVYMTGFRLPEGVVLPDFIVNPDYNKLAKLIRGGN